MPKSVTVYKITQKGYLKKVGKHPCPADDLMPPVKRKSRKYNKDAKTSLPAIRNY